MFKKSLLFSAAIIGVFILTACTDEESTIDFSEYKQTFTDESEKVVFVLDENDELFRVYYYTDENEENEEVRLSSVATNTGGIEENYINDNIRVLLTNNDQFIVDSTYVGNNIAVYEDVASFKVQEDEFNVLFLENDGDLYGFGSNFSAQVGNGKAGYLNEDPKTDVAYPILSDVKQYDINNEDDYYYSCVALTNAGEVYVWGHASTDYSLSDTAAHFILTPKLVADSADSYEHVSDGLIAYTSNGQVHIQEHVSDDAVIEEDNEETSNEETAYEPSMESFIQSIRGIDYAGDIGGVRGEIINNEYGTPIEVELGITYLKNGQAVGGDSLYVGPVAPGETVSFETSKSMVGLGATDFKISSFNVYK